MTPARVGSGRWIGALATVLLLASLALLPGAAAGQTKPKVAPGGLDGPHSILFVGNSFFYFNNGIDGLLWGLSTSGEPPLGLGGTMATISGSSLQWHDVESYFRPNAIGAFSFDAANNVVFNPPGKVFDVTVMMDCSQCPINPALKAQFADTVRKDAEIVRRHDAVPVLFMSWAYADRPEMSAALAEAYTQAGNDNNALVVPAGLAFARVVREHPEIVLYASDKRHPSLAGTYLAAATLYASFSGRSPVDRKYTAGLDERTARVLREAAWATVQAYHAK
jgi:hypothetical protein